MIIGVGIGIPFNSSRAFNPATQFAPALPGLWYDPSDYATLSQDSAGATPVTGVNQTVGRMLDKSGRGNTYSQATAPARALTSARVNVLIKSQDFADPIWQAFAGLTKIGNAPIAGPNGVLAYEIAFGTTGGTIGGAGGLYQVISTTNGNLSFFVRAKTGSTTVRLSFAAEETADVTVTDSAWTRISLNSTSGATPAIRNNVAGNSANVYIAQAQVAPGTTPGTYQRVNTATDYDEVGFPRFNAHDGVDDSGATGAITLSADMDCFIAIRRNAANAILAYAGVSNLFGAAESGSVVAADAGSGTPTYAANGVSLNGGAVGTTRGQVFTALTAVQFVVLEIRNLNLATGWATFGLGNAGAGFFINGDFGGMILAPAGDATTRTNNRKFLGAKVGLSL